MGTRNLTIVIENGTHKLAQYAQWDGYPEGQGLTALDFCREHLASDGGRATFNEKLNMVRFVDSEEYKKFWDSIGVDLSNKDWVNMEESIRFDKKYPYFSRDIGAKILSYIWNADDEVLTSDSYDFAADSLFCEWAYVIDLDKKTFEVYKGFNKAPLQSEERFASLERDGEYFPVRHLKTYSLDSLPTEDKFLADPCPKDDE